MTDIREQAAKAAREFDDYMIVSPDSGASGLRSRTYKECIEVGYLLGYEAAKAERLAEPACKDHQHWPRKYEVAR